MRRLVSRFRVATATAVIVGGMLAAFSSIVPASAAASISESPSTPATWATDVPYGQTNPAPSAPNYFTGGTATAPAGITVTAKSCAAAVTSMSGTSGGPGLTIAGVNSAGVSAVSAGAIAVLSYGSTNTSTTSTAVVGQIAGQTNVAGVTDSNGYLLPGTYTFTFTAAAGGATCVTSATYTINVAATAFTTVGGAASGQNMYIFDNSYNQSNSQTIDVIDGSGLTGAPLISSSSPGSGFVCNATTDPTVYDHECILQAAAGPTNGDDSGVVGANGTANTLVMEDSNNSATSNAYTVNVYNPPICAVAPDGTGSLSGTIDTTYMTSGDPTDAEACYDGASGPASTLLTGISASGGTIFTGANPVDAGGGLALTIMAGPGFNWTGSAGSGEADVDTGTAGLSKQTWPGATTTAPPPSTLTSTSTVASEASFKSSGDPLNTCPPLPAMSDAGSPFCFEEFEYSGAGPSAGQAALEYTGQNNPTSETPTVALSAGSGSVGSSIGITDQSGACPATIGSGTTNFFNGSYNCWYGRAGDSTPATVTVGGVPEAVTPTNPSAGDISEADYTVNGPNDSASPGTITLVNVMGASNQVTTSVSSAGTASAPYNDLIGDGVSGTDIPTGTEVTQVANNGNGTWTFTLSNAATATPAAETLTFFANVLNPPQLNASFTIAPGTPTGPQPVETCETTTPESGNDWEFGVQWLAPSGSLQYVNGNSGPTQVCASTTIDVETASSSTATTPGSSSIVLGTSNTDSATVTGSVSNLDPTGTVDFYECGPTASPAPCTSGSWAQFDTESLSGTSNPGTTVSAPFTPTATGYWCFAGVYSGDSNYAGSSDTSTDECFDVSGGSSSTISAPTSSSASLGVPNSDVATITGSDGSVDPTGTVSFYECGPTATPEPCTTGSQFDTESLNGTSNPAIVTSSTITPTATGYWCFAAVYSGDGNYAGSSDTSTEECFDVTQASSSTASEPTSSSASLGGPNSDVATITGSDGSVDPTGTVSFYECGPTATPEPCTTGSQFDTESLNGTSNPAIVTSSTINPDSVGYWCFAAVYSGDGNYAGSSDTGTEECFDVTQATTSLTSHPTDTTIDLGQADTDLATVTGNASGGNPTGSVSFYECGPTATPQPCTPQANEIGSAVNLTSEGSHSAYGSSLPFTPSSTGYWCFGSYYSGDSNYLASSDTTVDECVDVVQPLSITSSSPLPSGTEHVRYRGVTLQATGGTAPYTWVLFKGSLPPGLTLETTGKIKGTPDSSGTFTFTVKVRDSSSPRQKVIKKFQIVISP